MFVIFGTGPKEKIEAEGKFVCPNCNVLKNYLVKSSRQFFRLFFIPLIPMGDKTDPGVECQTCKFRGSNAPWLRLTGTLNLASVILVEIFDKWLYISN